MSPPKAQRWQLRNHAMALAFILLVLVFFWQTFDLSRASVLIPRAVLTITLVFLLAHLLRERQTPIGAAQGGSSAKTLPAIAWVCALPAFCWLLGIPVGAGVYSLVWMRWSAGERWAVSMLYALSLGTLVLAIFGYGLQIDLHQGFWAEHFN